jgi:flagellin
MSMSLLTNISANRIQDDLTNVELNLQQALERLGSGKRINSPSDDAAGYQISVDMTTQIQGIGQGESNTDIAVNLLQTAQGAISPIQQILSRMRVLAVQASSDTLSPTNRSAIQNELNALLEQINSFATTTEFNGVRLLDGSISGPLPGQNSSAKITTNVIGKSGSYILASITYGATGITQDETFELQLVSSSSTPGGVDLVVTQVLTDGTVTQTTYANVTSGFSFSLGGITFLLGTFSTLDIGDNPVYVFGAGTVAPITANNALQVQTGANAGTVLQIGLPDLRAPALGLSSMVHVESTVQAEHLISVLDKAIQYVNTVAGSIGASINSAQSIKSYQQNYQTNLSASLSTIQDANMAEEISNMTRESILMQASESALAQAQQFPQAILQLLR